MPCGHHVALTGRGWQDADVELDPWHGPPVTTGTA